MIDDSGHAPDRQATPSQSSESNLEKVERATETANSILQRYQNFDHASPEFIRGVIEFLAPQSFEDHRALVHPLTGIHTERKTMPGVAHLREFIEARQRERKENAAARDRKEAETQERARRAMEDAKQDDHRKAIRARKEAKLREAQVIWPDAWIDWEQQDPWGNPGVLRSTMWGKQVNDGWTFDKGKLWPPRFTYQRQQSDLERSEGI